MNNRWLFLSVLLAVVPAACAAEVSVYFSPHGGCERAIIREIDDARSSIKAAVYYLTEREISNALISAKKRGVDISIVLDRSQESAKYSKALYLSKNGITPFINSEYAIMHNKYAIIDGKTVITGSYNWTAAAEEKNAENLLVIRDEDVAGAYQRNFDKLLEESAKFAGRTGSEPAEEMNALPRSEGEDVTVYVTKSGKKYHCAGCKYLSKSMIPISLSEAKARGYSPCSACSPPR